MEKENHYEAVLQRKIYDPEVKKLDGVGPVDNRPSTLMNCNEP